MEHLYVKNQITEIRGLNPVLDITKRGCVNWMMRQLKYSKLKYREYKNEERNSHRDTQNMDKSSNTHIIVGTEGVERAIFEKIIAEIFSKTDEKYQRSVTNSIGINAKETTIRLTIVKFLQMKILKASGENRQPYL